MKNYTFKNWIIELFKDERGSISVKPVIAAFGTLILATVLILNVLKKSEFDPSSVLVDSIVWIVIAGMGSDTLDKFSSKKNSDSTTV